MRKFANDLFDEDQPNMYFARAKAKACEVAPPLGYDVIRELESKKKVEVSRPRQTNQKRKVLEFPEMINPKTIFNKKGLENEGDIQVKDVGRINQIVAGEKLKEFIEREESIRENSEKIKWMSSPQEQVLKYMELLAYIPVDHLLAVHDYALSEYSYLCQTNNPHLRKYLERLISKEAIQYKIIPTYLTSETYLSAKENVETLCAQDKDAVVKYIQDFNQARKRSDPFYSGCHLFLGLDQLPPVPDEDYATQERRFLKLLQYYITMISGILGDGQVAILRLYSSIQQKTNEFIFMLRWMFYKLSIIKPMLSNHMDHEKFLICEGYRKSSGDKIHRILVENYDLLRDFGDKKLIVKTEVIGKTDYNTFMQDYNNRILHYEFKTLNSAYNQNSNTLYLPHEEFLLGKLKNAYDPDGLVDEVLGRIFEEKHKIQTQEMKEEESKKMNKAEEPRSEEPGKQINLLSVMGIKKNNQQ